MKRIHSKQIIPIITAIIAIVFLTVGITQLGFWDAHEGPKPGFFPSIIATVMLLTSILAFFQSLKDTVKADYNKHEFLVIAAGAGVIAASFLIGLVPSCLLFVVLWLKIFEKESWKITLIVLAVISAIVIGVFVLWLGIQFPMGVFENFM